VNIETLDLNLLKVFEALAEERNATRAGERVGLTQPSVSNALNRLRQVFGDELFVRTPKGMVPTQRAEQLDRPVREALDQLRDALSSPVGFQLVSATGTVRISTSDLLVVSLAPRLLRAVKTSAPNIDLQFVPLDKRTLFRDLDTDRIDLSLNVVGDLPKRLMSRPFMRDRFICLGRTGHPAFATRLTLERFATYPHVLVSLKADSKGAIDTALAEYGLSRRVGATVSHFLSVPDMLAGTNYLAAVPASAERILTSTGACEAHALPLNMPDWIIQMIWSRRADNDPVQAWVRTRLNELSTL
jgi:DNA-binding transcriptional LysR family regulator